jgi:hypothetical protein
MKTKTDPFSLSEAEFEVAFEKLAKSLPPVPKAA